MEFYKRSHTTYKTGEDKYDPLVEEDVARGAGFKQVHASRKHEMTIKRSV